MADDLRIENTDLMEDEDTDEEVAAVATPESEPVEAPQASPTGYRYVCTACTNTAFTSETKEKFANKTCSSCGNQTDYSDGNYIAL